jgi:hypothetical protein
MIEDFERFQNELDALRKLFGPTTNLEAVLPRLTEIYHCTEAKWCAYARQIPQGVVRYVLIAEAPPWSPEGRPQFWLDPESGVQLSALRHVFCRTRLDPYANVLEVAAKHGFLILESIPFAMKYFGKRASPRYNDLVRLTAKSYLQAKVDASSLRWSPSLRIAFSLKRNALAIISASGGELSFGGHRHPLSPEQIAVNRAGFPDAKKLRELFKIDSGG